MIGMMEKIVQWGFVEFANGTDSGLTATAAPEGHRLYLGDAITSHFVVTQPLEESGDLYGSHIGGHVAEIPVPYSGRETALRNVRLIAAAPELLEACRQALASLRWLEENEVAELVETAIRKAVGYSEQEEEAFLAASRVLAGSCGPYSQWKEDIEVATSAGLIELEVDVDGGRYVPTEKYIFWQTKIEVGI